MNKKIKNARLQFYKTTFVTTISFLLMSFLIMSFVVLATKDGVVSILPLTGDMLLLYLMLFVVASSLFVYNFDRKKCWVKLLILKNEMKNKLNSLSVWAWLVKDRDGFECVFCGSKYNLHSHHIIPRSRSDELKFNLFNGITVCRGCHTIAENIYRRIEIMADVTPKVI